jgi:ABC-type cobalt transport system substrate-binding protein
MRYIRLRAWLLIGGLVLILFLLLKFAADSSGVYEGEHPITEQVITENYPKLYNGVFERDIGEIESFLTHNNDTLRSQAWRALASTPVDSLDAYLELAAQQNSEVAWFALSKHHLTSDQLRALEKLWGERPELRSGIARLLGQQGDEESFSFLLDALETDIAEEYHYALALSRLILRFELTESQQVRLLQNAFDTNSNKVRRAYLYGRHRGALLSLQPVP